MNPPQGVSGRLSASGPRPEIVCVVMSVLIPFVNWGGTYCYVAGMSVGPG